MSGFPSDGITVFWYCFIILGLAVIIFGCLNFWEKKSESQWIWKMTDLLLESIKCWHINKVEKNPACVANNDFK